MGKDHFLVFPLFCIQMHVPGVSGWTTLTALIFIPVLFIFNGLTYLDCLGIIITILR